MQLQVVDYDWLPKIALCSVLGWHHKREKEQVSNRTRNIIVSLITNQRIFPDNSWGKKRRQIRTVDVGLNYFSVL